MELPTYNFSIPSSISSEFCKQDHGPDLKKKICDELERELMSIERQSIDWEAISGIREGGGGELAFVLEEAFKERSRQLSGAPAYVALLNRRSRIALLEMRTRQADGLMQLVIAPGHVVSALEDTTGDWFRMVLERQMVTLYRSEGVDVSPDGILVSAINIPPYSPPVQNDTSSQEPNPPGDSRLNRTLQRFGAALLLMPIVLVGLILFLFYSWVADVRNEYDDLKQTINVQKEQIIKVVEEGLETSTDVMDIIDLVKDVTIGEDSTDQP